MKKYQAAAILHTWVFAANGIAASRSKTFERTDEAQLESIWLALTTQQIGDPTNHAQARCARYFQDRAGGLLRSRRPEVFRALESQ